MTRPLEPVPGRKREPTVTGSFQIVERVPTSEEYEALIRSAGWERFTNLEPVPQALQNSLFCVIALSEGKTIGMGRLVGDGVRSIYIQDVVVVPSRQRQGVGTAIVDRLVAWINANAPYKTYVHLFTQKETSPFYERYGFEGPEKSLYGMSLKKFKKPLGRKRSSGG